MGVFTKTVTAYVCERCGHEWVPRAANRAGGRTALPRVCAQCKSPYWNQPRRGAAPVSPPIERKASQRMLSNVFIHFKRSESEQWTNDERCMSSVPRVGEVVYPEQGLGPYVVEQVDYHPWRSPVPGEPPQPYAEDVEIWLAPTSDEELPRRSQTRLTPAAPLPVAQVLKAINQMPPKARSTCWALAGYDPSWTTTELSQASGVPVTGLGVVVSHIRKRLHQQRVLVACELISRFQGEPALVKVDPALPETLRVLIQKKMGPS